MGAAQRDLKSPRDRPVPAARVSLEARAAQQIDDFPNAGGQRGMPGVKTDCQFLQSRPGSLRLRRLFLQRTLDVVQDLTQQPLGVIIQPRCGGQLLVQTRQRPLQRVRARICGLHRASSYVNRPTTGMKQPPQPLDDAAIDALYGLEPVIEPEREGAASSDADAVGFATIQCPYCGEPFETQVDASAGSTSYIEDCHVCCRPIEIALDVAADGSLTSVNAQRSD